MKHLIPILLIVASTNTFAKPCDGEVYELKIGLYEGFLRCLGKDDWWSRPVLQSETVTAYATHRVYKIRYWRTLPNGEYERRYSWDETRIHTTKTKHDDYAKVTMISR